MDTRDYGYPENWPVCPGCGKPSLDGHITCGRAGCDEGAQRVESNVIYEAGYAYPCGLGTIEPEAA